MKRPIGNAIKSSDRAGQDAKAALTLLYTSMIEQRQSEVL